MLLHLVLLLVFLLFLHAAAPECAAPDAADGGASGSEVRIAWPATAASERRREIGDGGREGTRGVEAPGA
eukprot:scaffold293887_cov18-Tisochrysis_lutea.AAC.1